MCQKSYGKGGRKKLSRTVEGKASRYSVKSSSGLLVQSDQGEYAHSPDPTRAKGNYRGAKWPKIACRNVDLRDFGKKGTGLVGGW